MCGGVWAIGSLAARGCRPRTVTQLNPPPPIPRHLHSPHLAAVTQPLVAEGAAPTSITAAGQLLAGPVQAAPQSAVTERIVNTDHGCDRALTTVSGAEITTVTGVEVGAVALGRPAFIAGVADSRCVADGHGGSACNRWALIIDALKAYLRFVVTMSPWPKVFAPWMRGSTRATNRETKRHNNR